MVGAGSKSQDSVWTQVGQTWLSNMTDEDSVASFRISALRRPERTGQVHMQVNLIRKRARPACPQGPRSTVSPQIPLMARRGGMEPPSLSWGSCTRTASVSILPPAWGVWRLPRPLTRVLHTSPETSPWTHGTFALETQGRRLTEPTRLSHLTEQQGWCRGNQPPNIVKLRRHKICRL